MIRAAQQKRRKERADVLAAAAHPWDPRGE